MTDVIGPQKPRRRRRRLHWHVGIWMVLSILLFGLFMVFASMSLTGRVVTLPDEVTTRISARVNDRLEGVGISLGRVELGVTPDGRPRLRLVNVGVRDQTGLEVAQLNAVEGGVKFWPLLAGRVEPSGIYLSGAQVTVRRRADGTFDLSFGQAGGASGDLAAILDAVDGVFSAGPLSTAALIEADQMTITLEDARSGRLWQVTDGQLKLTQTDKLVDITVSFDVFNQTEELAETVLGFRLAKGSSEASLGASFTNARAADIAAQTPALAFLSVVDAPISGALRAVVDADGQTSDLAGTLSFGAGALSPTPGARPVRFDGGRIYMDYDPALQRVNFPEISLTTDWGTARGEGVSYLQEWVNGWPTTLVSQYRITEAALNPQDLFPEPVQVEGGAVDMRLRLDPFTLDIGQLVLHHADNTYTARGTIRADSSGWSVAMDAHADQVTRDQLLTLWPLSVAPKPRDWVARNITRGTATDARFALRTSPGVSPRLSLGTRVTGATVHAVPKMVPIRNMSGYFSIEGNRLVAVAESGQIVAPSGHRIAVAGTSFTMPDMSQKPTPAEVQLAVAGEIPGILSVLDGAPFDIFKASDTLGPDLAQGRAVARGNMDLLLRPKMQFEDVQFDIAADLAGLHSDKLIPGKTLTADRGRVAVTHERIEVSGEGRVGQVATSGSWSMSLRPEDKGQGSRVEGRVALSQTFLDAFNIGLPPGTVSGEGVAEFSLDLPVGAPPRLRLTSDLNRLGLSMAPVGWSKPANRTGRLLAEGVLGTRPRIDRLELEAPGLTATGQVTTDAAGKFQEARFDRVSLGGWLDAPVTFTARGPGQAVAVAVRGGSADMRRATFAEAGGGPVETQDTPITLALDWLTISEGIVLTGFAADLNRKGGLQGRFTAAVQGGGPIQGTVAPQPDGSAFRITSADAGAVLRGAGVFENGRGGDLELTLAPLPGEGTYEGLLRIKDARVKDAPAMAELLSAISVIGILEQLDGEGLVFTETEARFRLEPDKVTVYRSSAVGPSLGISMDGFYDLVNSKMNMQGVISPFYAVNVIGRIFSRKGEGLVGFTFRLRGSPEDPRVSVNPLSLFTPGMFREIFRRSPPPRPEN